MSAARLRLHVMWALITLLSIGVAGYAFYHVATGFRNLPPINDFPNPLGLQVHVAASAVAMLLGPFQFLRVLRNGQPALHRWSGRAYVLACVIGGLAGVAIALYANAGLVAGAGFLGLGLAWLFTTGLAYAAALRRDFGAHERWMVRSFALTFAAVTLRIYLGLAVATSAGGFPTDAYVVIAWACWVPNLIIAELWIAHRRKPRRPKVTPTAAPA